MALYNAPIWTPLLRMGDVEIVRTYLEKLVQVVVLFRGTTDEKKRFMIRCIGSMVILPLTLAAGRFAGLSDIVLTLMTASGWTSMAQLAAIHEGEETPRTLGTADGVEDVTTGKSAEERAKYGWVCRFLAEGLKSSLLPTIKSLVRVPGQNFAGGMVYDAQDVVQVSPAWQSETFELLGQPEQAIISADIWLARAPHNPVRRVDELLVKGRCFAKTGDVEAASTCFVAGLRIARLSELFFVELLAARDYFVHVFDRMPAPKSKARWMVMLGRPVARLANEPGHYSRFLGHGLAADAAGEAWAACSDLPEAVPTYTVARAEEILDIPLHVRGKAAVAVDASTSTCMRTSS